MSLYGDSFAFVKTCVSEHSPDLVVEFRVLEVVLRYEFDPQRVPGHYYRRGDFPVCGRIVWCWCILFHILAIIRKISDFRIFAF